MHIQFNTNTETRSCALQN